MKQDDSKLRLYLSHRAALVDYATPLVGDRGRAEDVVQEAFLRFVPEKAERSAKGMSQPLGYLYRIVRNLALDIGRRRRYERQQEADPAWWTIPAEPCTPEQELAHKAELARVRAALDDISPRARLAVEMQRFGGYTLQEVADHLGISVPSAHRLIRDALVQVALRLGTDGGPRQS